MNFEHIFPKKSKILKLFLIYSLVLLVLMYGIFSSRFGWAYLPKEDVMPSIIQDVICLLIWAVICGISYYVFTKQNYYVILKDGIVHHKWTKETKHDFNNILYIDIDYTKKHGTLLFYTNFGKPVYLVLDKNEIILSTIQKKAKNLISRSEFHSKFPNVQL